MTVKLISVGTEILTGNIVNSNTQFLAEKCAMLGFDLLFQVTVGDNYDRMMSVVRQALSHSDILILIGGLGPTEDDLTKEVCADAFGMPLVEDVRTRERLKESFRSNIYRHIPDNNRKMATIPQGALALDSTNGMVPGLILEKGGKTAILLPGPPNELCPMLSRWVSPYFQQKQNAVLVSSTAETYGYGESQVEDIILDLIDAQTNPTVATYAKTTEVYLRITARAGSRKEGMTLIAPVEKGVKNRFKDAVYTTEEQVSLEMAVMDLLKQNHLTVCTTESCTGGMITARMVNVLGVSGVFMEGMVAYSNEAKMRLLGVHEDTLKAYDTISEETAREMAESGANTSGADLCVATTSMAGPDGSADEKPVGLIYMACCLRGKTYVRRYQFKDNREEVREQVVMRALDPARLCILANK